MRILIVQPWIRQGGAELLSLHLAAALEEQGHEAPIAALFVEPAGLPAIVRSRRYVLPPAWLARRFARSRALTYLVGPFALLVLAFRAARDADVLNPHNLPAPVIAAIVGRARGLPVVWSLNEVPQPLPPDQARQVDLLERTIWLVGSTLARQAAGVPREILTLSEKAARSVREHYGRDATVVMPGVDVAAYEPGPRHAARVPTAPARDADRAPRLLWVGKLHPQKNPALAVRTLARVRATHPRAQLAVVGDGPLRPALDELARGLGAADALRFRAGVDVEELRRLYQESDVLLVTATGHQSWGLTPFEALAAGTPAVVSVEAGGAEVLAKGDAALVAPPEELPFAAAVERLLDDPALAAHLVANGRALLSRELTWRRFAQRCERAFAAARA